MRLETRGAAGLRDGLAAVGLPEKVETVGGAAADAGKAPPSPDATAVAASRELAHLYRQACADLIRAKSETANSELIGYLNGLVGRSYGAIYRGQRFRLLAALRFALVGFPRRFRARWTYVLAAALFLLAGGVFGFVAEATDPTAKHYLVPREVAAIEEQIATSPAAKGGTAMPIGQNMLASTGIMTNNVSVTFVAFALGATGGIGTAAALFYNGLLVGVLAAIFTRHSLTLGFWALILPHGVIELTAIFVAGGAGFLVGRALLAPGDVGRRAAVAALGSEAVELAVGCALMLIPAGLIEGFVTPQPAIPASAKVAIGALTGAILLVFFVWNEELLEGAGLLDALRVEPGAPRRVRRPGEGD